MGNTQVNKWHPVNIAADPRAPKIVKNISGATAYYRFNSGIVSSATNDGSIAVGSEVTLITPTWFVTAEDTDTELQVKDGAPLITTAVPATVPGRRQIESVSAAFKENEAVGTYFTVGTEPFFVKATALKVTSGEKPVNLMYLSPDLFEVAGRVSQLTTELFLITDAVAPTCTFKAGLYKLEKVEGAEKKHEATFEAVVAGSIATLTTPAKEVFERATTTFSAVGLAAGFYALGLETITATSAAKSFEAVTIQLYAAS